MRVLYLTHRVPYAPNRGDRIRAFHTLRVLQSHVAVDLVSLAHDDAEAERAEDVRPLVSSVRIARVRPLHTWSRAAATLLTRRPLTHALLSASDIRPHIRSVLAETPPTVVLAFCSGMARFALEPPLNRHPVVIDMVDVDSAKWLALAEAQSHLDPRSLLYRREALSLKQFEVHAAAHAFATVVINSRERAALVSAGAAGRIEVVGNGVDSAMLAGWAHPSEAPNVVLSGIMDYQPNEHGALWVLAHVWPGILRERPDAKLWIVGANPTRRLQAAAALYPSVHVTHSVPDVRPYIARAAVAIAPIFISRGMQNKVIEAVAGGVPVVVTPQVMAGLPPEVRPACLEAADAPGFCAAVIRLLNSSPRERRAIANAVNLATFTWEQRLQPLVDLLRAASVSNTA